MILLGTVSAPLTLIFIPLACKKAPEKTLGSLNFTVIIYNYSMIVATRPDPTVRPPSRIANVRPCSIAIG